MGRPALFGLIAAAAAFAFLTVVATGASGAAHDQPVAPAGTTPKAKRVKLACALRSGGSLRFITSSRRCGRRVGKLVRLDPGPAEICVRKRGTIKPRAVAAARRVTNQLAACGRRRVPNEKRLTLPSARDEFFCVERRSKNMRQSKRCRKRGRFAEFLAFVPKKPPAVPNGPGNSAPRAEADSASTDEESAVAIAVAANDSDPDGDPVTVGAVDASATVGTVAVGPGGAVTYSPAGMFNDLGPGETATDSFTYTARDPSGAQSPATRVQVTVGGVDDAPRIAPGGGGPSTFTEDQAGQVPVDAGVSVTDVDSDRVSGATVAITGGRASGDTLHFASTAAISGTYDSGTGVLTLTGDDSVAGYQDALRSVTFSTPNQDPGTTRTVEFSAGGSAPAARDLVVAPVNDAPVANDETLNGASRAVGNTSLVANDPSDGAPNPPGPQKTIVADLLANDNDVDGPALGVRPETVGTLDGGQVVLEADGDFTYHPPQGCTGGSSDTFEYNVEDNHPSAELTDTAKVTISIAECVWYVDDSAPAGGDGRSHAPYNTLADLDGVGGAGDEDATSHRLFLYDGTYTGGLPLESSQSLFSEKHGLALADGGTGTVTLEPADGAGTELLGGLQLASGNNVQGLDLGNTAGSSVFALSGSSVGSAGVNNETSGDIDNQVGGAISIGGTANTIDMQFGELSSNGSSTSAVTLANTTGTFSASSGTLANSTGTTVAINGGSGNFTLGGDVADGTGQVLSIQNRTGSFTHDFNGGVSGGAVLLQTNAGTTRFDGGLILSTGTASALTASNAGTLAITDPNGSGLVPDNTIATTTGQALNLSGTTIHSDDLTFRRISSTGAPTGIALSNTGSAGSLNVAGNGGTCDSTPANCTGGAIQNSTGPGIQLTNVGGAVDLNRMSINNGLDDGISGASVNGFALRNSVVRSNGNGDGEMGLEFTNLTGTVALATDTVTGSADHNVSVANTSGTLDMTVTGGTYGSNSTSATGEDGILVDANNSAIQNVAVTGSSFSNNKGDHVQFSTGATGTPTQDVSIANTQMTTTALGDPLVAGGGITISPSGAAVVDAAISGNNIQNSKNRAIRVDAAGSSTGSDHLDARITNNIIGTAASAGSGSFSSDGVFLGANGSGRVDVLMTGNQVRQYSNTHGIFMNHSGPSPTLNATVTGNTVANPSNSQGGAGGVMARAGVVTTPTADAGTMCLDLGANDLGGAGTENATFTDIRVEELASASIQFPGFNPAATTLANYLTGRNTGSPSVSTSGTAFQAGPATCPQPDL